MKRFLILLLCLTLLLSAAGCASFKQTKDPAAVSETAGDSDKSTDAPSQPADAPSEEPSAAEAQSTDAPAPQANSSGVYTDDSQLTPRPALPGAKYTRLSDELIRDLKPGSYGSIFPFTGEPLFTGTDSGYLWAGGSYTGFVTGKGEIICDPTYTEAYQVFYYNYENYSASHGLPLWAIGRTSEVEEVVEGEYSWLEGKTLYAVAAMDGSFVLPAQFIRVEGTPNGFIGYRSWETADFDCYDLNGNRIFGAAELRDLIGDSSYCSVSAAGELYLLYANDATYLLDGQGKRLIGPMKSLDTESEGLINASQDGEHYGYLDLQGNWVIEPNYTNARPFRDGLAVVDDGDCSMVIDRQGAERIREYGGYITRCDDYFQFNGSNASARMYDASGKLLYEDSSRYWNHLDNSIFYCWNGDSILVRDVVSGRQTQIQDGSYFFDPSMFETGAPMDAELYYKGQRCYIVCCWHYNEQSGTGYTTYSILSPNLDLIEIVDDKDMMTVFDTAKGESYLAFSPRGTKNWTIYDKAGTEIGTYSGSCRIINGYVQATDDYAARLYDPSGNEVFCYPLMALLAD